MKTLRKTYILLFTLSVSFSSCIQEALERVTYKANVPIYMEFKVFRSSFSKSEPVDITNPGKIYFKDNYLFINEVGKGIHVIDNTNPATPRKLCFYEIMGNVDIAVRGNILFADSYIDLVAIDITDIHNPVEVDRIKNIFPEVMPEGDSWLPYAMVDQSKGVIVGWEVKTITEVHKSGSECEDRLYRGKMTLMSTGESRANWSAGAGTAGSMARFLLNGRYLYLIAHPWMLKTVDVGEADKMRVADSVDISSNMETLFLLGDKMFIGTTTGMLIYDISYAPRPRFVSQYDHITACDPVVADGSYAFVTLHTGTKCQNGENLLEVIDISSINTPYLVKSYPMYNPYGLGLDGRLLFVCDGAAGLKIYDRTDPLDIINRKLAHYPDFFSYDVIPFGGVLILVGDKGINQYDYSDPLNIVQLSHIPVSGGTNK